MERITFTDVSGLAGRFTTVRKGDDWFKRVSQGEDVELADAQGNVIAHANVADGWQGDLARVPASVLEMEASALHRTYSGLIMGLRAYYGDPVKSNMPITVLILDFKPVPKSKLVLPS